MIATFWALIMLLLKISTKPKTTFKQQFKIDRDNPIIRLMLNEIYCQLYE